MELSSTNKYLAAARRYRCFLLACNLHKHPNNKKKLQKEPEIA
jgi:hypothetical protein